MEIQAIIENIKSSIESMSKYNQIEILKILINGNCKLNENKSGVYINLSLVEDSLITALSDYIKYTNEQETNLITYEYQKEVFKTTMKT
jgi:stage III sporulation protein SpoIIIAA